MIGPHQDRELELMLAGKKPLAAFSYDWREGNFSPELQEVCIPDAVFSPYVKSGRFLRFERLWQDGEGVNIKYVCFTQPAETWRAEAYMGLRMSIQQGGMVYDDAVDVIIGRLLGYSEEDIQDFLRQSAKILKK